MPIKTYRYILSPNESLRQAYDFFDARTNLNNRENSDLALLGQEIFHVEDKLYSSKDLPEESEERRRGCGLVTRTIFFRPVEKKARPC
jgi:hypothetical protein